MYSSDTSTLANSFDTFLQDKITKIRAVFQKGQNDNGSEDIVKPTTLHLNFFPSN